MPDPEYLTRSVHDLTAAVWFGGSLMGAVGVNGAAAAAADPRERIRLSAVGWRQWRPVETAALVAHGLAGAAMIRRSTVRPAARDGAARRTALKAAVTVAGIVGSAWAGAAGRRAEALAHEGAEGATEPHAGASPELASAQRQLRVLQWVNPLLAGTVVVLGAEHGEMQRPRPLLRGLLR